MPFNLFTLCTLPVGRRRIINNYTVGFIQLITFGFDKINVSALKPSLLFFLYGVLKTLLKILHALNLVQFVSNVKVDSLIARFYDKDSRVLYNEKY